MDSPTLARATFGVTALCVAVGLAVQIGVLVDAEPVVFDTAGGRVANMFCYFTIWSNLIVGATALLLAIRLDRTSTTFRVFRLAGVVQIAVTGIVYHVALKELQELEGDAAVADQLLHSVVPVLGVLGWLVFGPRLLASVRVACLALVIPLVWMVLTMLRGELLEPTFYPYPFIDVAAEGYARVALSSAVVLVLLLALAFGATWLDGWLARRTRSVSPGSPSRRSSAPAAPS